MKKFTLKHDDTSDESGRLTAKEYNSLTQELVALVKNTRGDNDDHFIYEGDENNLDLSKAVFHNKTIKHGFSIVPMLIGKGQGHTFKQNYDNSIFLEIIPNKENSGPDLNKIFEIKDGHFFLCDFKTLDNSHYANKSPLTIYSLYSKIKSRHQSFIVNKTSNYVPPFYFDSEKKDKFLISFYYGEMNIIKIKENETYFRSKKIHFNHTENIIKNYLDRNNATRDYGSLSNKPYNFSKDDYNLNRNVADDNQPLYNPYKYNYKDPGTNYYKDKYKPSKTNINLLKAIKKPGIYKVKTKINYKYDLTKIVDENKKTPSESMKNSNDLYERLYPTTEEIKNFKVKTSVSLKGTSLNPNIYNSSEKLKKSERKHVNKFSLNTMLVHGYHNKNKRTNSIFYAIYNKLHPYSTHRYSIYKHAILTGYNGIPFRGSSYVVPSTITGFIQKPEFIHKKHRFDPHHFGSKNIYNYESSYSEVRRQSTPAHITRYENKINDLLPLYDKMRSHINSNTDETVVRRLFLTIETIDGKRFLGPIEKIKSYMEGHNQGWRNKYFHGKGEKEPNLLYSPQTWYWRFRTGFDNKNDYDTYRGGGRGVRRWGSLSFSIPRIKEWYRDELNSFEKAPKHTFQTIYLIHVLPSVNTSNIYSEIPPHKILAHFLSKSNLNHFRIVLASIEKDPVETEYDQIINETPIAKSILIERGGNNGNVTKTIQMNSKYRYSFLNYKNFYRVLQIHHNKDKIIRDEYYTYITNPDVFIEKTFMVPNLNKKEASSEFNAIELMDLIFNATRDSKLLFERYLNEITNSTSFFNLVSEMNIYNVKKQSISNLIEENTKYIFGGTKGFIKDPRTKEEITHIVQEYPYFVIDSKIKDKISNNEKTLYKKNTESPVFKAKNFNDIHSMNPKYFDYLQYYQYFMCSQGMFVYAIQKNEELDEQTTESYFQGVILRYYNEDDDKDKDGLEYIINKNIADKSHTNYQQELKVKELNTYINNFIKKAKQFENVYSINNFIKLFTPEYKNLLNQNERSSAEHIENEKKIIKSFYKKMYDVNLEYLFKSKPSNGYYGRFLTNDQEEWYQVFFNWYKDKFGEPCKYDFISDTVSIQIQKEKEINPSVNKNILKALNTPAGIVNSKEMDITLENEVIIDTKKINTTKPSAYSIYPLDINIEYEYPQDLIERKIHKHKYSYIKKSKDINNHLTNAPYDIENPLKDIERKELIKNKYVDLLEKRISTDLEIINEY